MSHNKSWCPACRPSIKQSILQALRKRSEILRCIPQSNSPLLRPWFLCLVRRFPMVATVSGYSLAGQTVPLHRLLHRRIRRRITNASTFPDALDEPGDDSRSPVHLVGGQAEVPHPRPRGGGRLHDGQREEAFRVGACQRVQHLLGSLHLVCLSLAGGN